MQFDTLIIGGGLNAVLYSYLNNIPIIYLKNHQYIPFPFEYFDINEDLSKYYIKKEVNNYVLRDKSIKSFGVSKKTLYERLIFFSSLAGLVPFSNTIHSISIEEDCLKVGFEFRTIEVKYNKLIIFEDEGINGLPNILNVSEKQTYCVVDWYNVRYGQEHEYGLFEMEDDFIKTIFFHPSSRTDGNLHREKIRKDVVSISILDKEQLEGMDFSETMGRLKIQKIMTESGIRGTSNGKFPNGKTQYFHVKLEHDEREIRKISRQIYQKCDIIEFMLDKKEEDILKEYKDKDISNYAHRLNERMYK